jgi:hypothetical protein
VAEERQIHPAGSAFSVPDAPEIDACSLTGFCPDAASTLGAMMAIESPRPTTLALDEEDPELVAAVGKLDPKHFHALVENLETLRQRYEHVLRADGERLSPELLFGMGQESRPGCARLSIVSTKFLGDNAAIDFWVARLLAELGRWASRRPADSLQAAIFLDEADIYLPTQTKPATKEPMLDLLKRARSAGLGVFLATPTRRPRRPSPSAGSGPDFVPCAMTPGAPNLAL